jgi:hypothetical protein
LSSALAALIYPIALAWLVIVALLGAYLVIVPAVLLLLGLH